MLKIPESQQGVLSGSLGLAATIVGLVMPSIWGTLSDKTGRRLVYALGLLISAFGIILYPLAGSVFMLYLFRMLFQTGSNASHTMSNALLADYIENKDRGKAIGITAMCGGIGALMTVFIFLRLPDMFVQNGVSLQNAGQYTFWIVAGLGILASILVGFGLLGKSQHQVKEKRTAMQIARDALRAARQDAGISLAYGVNFVASGAVTVVGTFFTLWIVTYGTTQAGLTSSQALARAGMIMGISQVMGLVAAPLFGILADRISRVLAVVIASGLTAIVFAATIFITNPLSSTMMVLGLFIGFVQISGVLTGGALIAQQAPASVRGSVMGFYGFCGALGTMLASVLGGFLFDRWSGQAPFVMSAVLCAFMVVWGLIVNSKSRRSGTS
jgi:MFS family permease